MKKRIKNLKHTPLFVAMLAIRTCWQSNGKSDTVYHCPECNEECISSVLEDNKLYCQHCDATFSPRQTFSKIGNKDKELIYRISRKYKHTSTIEHITVSFYTNMRDILRFFRENPFSKVLDDKYVYTNLRVLIENMNNPSVTKVISSKEFQNSELSFLFKDDFNIEKEFTCGTPLSQKNTDMSVELLNVFYDHKETAFKYSFLIQNISRAVLQELARHRVANLSVKSTRYTLKELKNETNNLLTATNETFLKEIAKRYIVFTGNETIDNILIEQLKNLKRAIDTGVSNDIAKYALPECYKTELVWSIDREGLANFINLRTSKSALWEIRDLANIIKSLSEKHLSLTQISSI